MSLSQLSPVYCDSNQVCDSIICWIAGSDWTDEEEEEARKAENSVSTMMSASPDISLQTNYTH